MRRAVDEHEWAGLRWENWMDPQKLDPPVPEACTAIEHQEPL